MNQPLKIGPASIKEIARRLKIEGFVYHSGLINDVLNAIVQAYIKKGRAEVRHEIDKRET